MLSLGRVGTGELEVGRQAMSLCPEPPWTRKDGIDRGWGGWGGWEVAVVREGWGVGMFVG